MERRNEAEVSCDATGGVEVSRLMGARLGVVSICALEVHSGSVATLKVVPVW